MNDAEEFLSKVGSLTPDDFIADTINPLAELKANHGNSMKCKMELFVSYLQKFVVGSLEQFEDEKKFSVTRWNRMQGGSGGGISCILQNGKTFEKAGVNVSVLWGDLNEQQIAPMRKRGKDLRDGKNSFFATGISCNFHPLNPYVPTLHFNYRYFEVLHESGHHVWWFGGCVDMTPYYLNEQEALLFHRTQKAACDKHNESFYPRFKHEMDEYLYIKHREEYRGIGGISFDDFCEGTIDECFGLLVSCAKAAVPAYIQIIHDNRYRAYTEKQREWQLVRRGRYVEFNLLYGRGTKFGLATPGLNVENILMPLPLNARWEYMYQVENGSEEEKLMELLKGKPRDWA